MTDESHRDPGAPSGHPRATPDHARPRDRAEAPDDTPFDDTPFDGPSVDDLSVDGAVGTPPLSHELLADLHGGVLDPDRAARLWPIVRADPVAAAYVRSLDAVSTHLTALAAAPPPAPIPAAIAERIDRAIAERTATERTRTRWTRPRYLLAAAAVAAVVAGAFATGATLFRTATSETADVASAPLGSDAHPVSDDGVSGGSPGTGALSPMPDDAAVHGIVGTHAFGPLDDPDRLRGCLSANGHDPASVVLGGVAIPERITLVLAGPSPGRLDVLVVGPTCSASDAATLGSRTIG